jgi:hypothetical protein
MDLNVSSLPDGDEQFLRVQIQILWDARADAHRGDVDAQRAAARCLPRNLYSQVRQALFVRRKPRRLAQQILALERQFFFIAGLSLAQERQVLEKKLNAASTSILIQAVLALEKARDVSFRLATKKQDPTIHQPVRSPESIRIPDGQRGERHPSQAARPSLLNHLMRYLHAHPWQPLT